MTTIGEQIYEPEGCPDNFMYELESAMHLQEMTAHEKKATKCVPGCVDLDQLDGTFGHVIFRVEHPVVLWEEGEREFYTKREVNACRKWLVKYAPSSQYAHHGSK